jgi:hypothetical protein
MYAIAQPIGIVVRMLAVALLVTGTYNPSGYSYYHWAFHHFADHWASKAVIGQIIVVAFVFCVHATVRSLGWLFGIPLILVIATGIWFLSDRGLVDLSDRLQRILVFEAVIVIWLSTGVCFSLIRYRLSGQLDSGTLT